MARTRGARTLRTAPFVPRAASTGAPGARDPRDLGPSCNQGPGANSSRPGPARGTGGAAAGDPRIHSMPNSARPAACSAQLGPAGAGAAPRVTCQEPERRLHLPPGRENSRGCGRPPGAGQGEGPPAPNPPPPAAPPPAPRAALAARRFPPSLRAVAVTLPPRPASSSRPLAVPAVTFSCLFSPLASASVTSGQSVLLCGQGATGTETRRDPGGSAAKSAESGRGRGGRGRSQPGPGRRAAGSRPRGSSRATAGGSLLLFSAGAGPSPTCLALLALSLVLRGRAAASPAGTGAGVEQPELETSSCLGGVTLNVCLHFLPFRPELKLHASIQGPRLLRLLCFADPLPRPRGFMLLRTHQSCCGVSPGQIFIHE